MANNHTEEYQYAKLYDPLLSPFIQPIRRYILAWVKERKYQKILDVCCGTGDQLKQLSSAGIEAEGVDLSDAMLTVAAQGDIPATCFKEDAARTHYDDGTFDLVMTTFALHEKPFETAREIVEEMVRVTQENGEILIVDYELSAQTSRLAKAGIWFIEWVAGGEHFANFKDYLSKGGLPRLLQGMPLREIKRHYFGQHGIVLAVFKKHSA